MRNLALITLFFTCAILRDSVAQEPPAVGSVKLYRYGELLREHGIELTEPALLNALKNPNPDVRDLAAMKLSEDKTADAIPAIEQALVAEKVPRARVNIALALGLLGDQAGNAELTKICADKNFVPEFRLYAVRYMFDLGAGKGENCLDAAEEIIESGNIKPGDRVSALELLSWVPDLTVEESQKVLKLLTTPLEGFRASCADGSESVVSRVRKLCGRSLLAGCDNERAR